VILRDITERKQAEHALRDSASKLQAALSSMSDAVCISDVEGRLIEFNDAFASFHGFPDKAACSRAVADYMDMLDVFLPNGEHATREQWPLARALRGETATNIEYSLRRKDTGASLIGSYSFAPICSESGTIAGAVVAARNVTAIREVQADLASSHFALQRLIASRDRVQEEERKRIARELHDDLQQTLSAIRMDLHFIATRFGEDAPELPPLVAGVDRLAERAVVSTRRIVNDLRPPMLEDLGLVPALEAMAGHFSQQTGIACEVNTPGEDAFNEWVEAPSVALCLYRVAQEALNNVAKHSHASEVHIRLAMATESSISLQIKDNGRGMAAADMRNHESFGILGIRERIRANGGIMRIDSGPQGGTVLDVLVPRAGAPGLPGQQATPGQLTDSGEGGAPRAEFDDAHALPRLLSRATDKTLQDVIDAIAGSVAVMDRRGTIRFVNRAWTEFVDHNGMPGPGSLGPGVNYLEACRSSSLKDESTRKVLRGLEGVIDEGRTTFTCEYPCHSPDELRWFRMHVTSMANGDVMIAHFWINEP
jgi:PAS domain S-box-containing protein